jgi:hypothetical protein
MATARARIGHSVPAMRCAQGLLNEGRQELSEANDSPSMGWGRNGTPEEPISVSDLRNFRTSAEYVPPYLVVPIEDIYRYSKSGAGKRAGLKNPRSTYIPVGRNFSFSAFCARSEINNMRVVFSCLGDTARHAYGN